MRHRPKTSNDPKRQTLKYRAQRRAIPGEVIGIAVTERDVRHRPGDHNQFRVNALFFQKTSALRQVHGEVRRVRRRANPDLIRGVDRVSEEEARN